MRLTLNACLWAVLAVAVWGTISVCSDADGPRPTKSSRPTFGPGHPPSCPLCKDPGPSLPDEIDEYNVHLVSAA